MKSKPPQKPVGDELNVLLTRLTFFNDNKMTHATLFFAVFFGQISLCGINPHLLKVELYCDNQVTIIFTIVYFVLALVGQHEISRFIQFSKGARTIHHYVATYYLLSDFDLQPPKATILTKFLSGKLFSNNVLMRFGYLILSAMIYSLIL